MQYADCINHRLCTTSITGSNKYYQYLWVCRTCNTSTCFSCAKRFTPHSSLLSSSLSSLPSFISYCLTDVMRPVKVTSLQLWRDAGAQESQSKVDANVWSYRRLLQMEATHKCRRSMMSFRRRCAAVWLILALFPIRMCYCTPLVMAYK